MKQKFTAEEDSIIREMWPSYHCQVIADKLGRSYESVRHRAMRLHLQKTPAFYQECRTTRTNCLVYARTRRSTENMSIAMKNLFRKERIREKYGLQRKTKLNIQQARCRRFYTTRWQLIHKYGYIDTTAIDVLFYDENTTRVITHRNKPFFCEESITQRLGIRFMQADD